MRISVNTISSFIAIAIICVCAVSAAEPTITMLPFEVFNVESVLYLNDETILALGGAPSYLLYKSSDEGQTWAALNVSGLNEGLLPDEVNSNIVYGLGSSENYVSQDAGSTWTAWGASIDVDYLVPNPILAGSMLAATNCIFSFTTAPAQANSRRRAHTFSSTGKTLKQSRSEDTTPSSSTPSSTTPSNTAPSSTNSSTTPSSSSTQIVLLCDWYVTLDAAASWSLIYPASSVVNWGLDANQPSRSFAINENQDLVSCLGNQSAQFITSSVVQFAVSPNSLMFMTDQVQFFISPSSVDPTHTNFSLYTAPAISVALYDYFVLIESTPGQDWLGFLDPQLNVGALCVTQLNGQRVATVIESVYQVDGIFDVQPFSGLEGVFLANQVDFDLLTGDTTNVENVLQTIVTFDNGLTWNPITLPANTTCPVSPCSLTLSLPASAVTDNAQLPAASAQAPGIMIANGKLTENKTPFTYFTNNGGRTWRVLYNSQTIFAIGNGGGIITFVDYMDSAYTIWYSLDYGATLQIANLNSTNDVILDIFAPPSDYGVSMWAYSYYPNNTIFNIDFSPMLTYNCGPSDYGTITYPNDGSCVLGRQVTYYVKGFSSMCVSSETSVPSPTISVCACTLEDYECGPGLTPIAGNMSYCVPAIEPICLTTYTFNQTLFLAQNDSCEGGVQPDPILRVEKCSKVFNIGPVVEGLATTISSISSISSSSTGSSYTSTVASAASSTGRFPSTSSTSGSNNQVSQPNGQLSAGGKAGVAIAVVVAVGIIAAVVALILRKRARAEPYGRHEDDQL